MSTTKRDAGCGWGIQDWGRTPGEALSVRYFSAARKGAIDGADTASVVSMRTRAGSHPVCRVSRSNHGETRKDRDGAPRQQLRRIVEEEIGCGR